MVQLILGPTASLAAMMYEDTLIADMGHHKSAPRWLWSLCDNGMSAAGES
jgi:hypothetical protein